MRTIRPVHTGPRVPIHVLRQRRPGRTPVLRREQRLSPVLVRHVGPAVTQPIVEEVAEPAREADESLTVHSVLDRRVRLRPMTHLQTLVLGVVVVDVEGTRSAPAQHRVPEQRERDVGPRGVLVRLKVFENRFRVFGVEFHVPAVLVGRDVRRDYLDVKLWVDGVDSPEPPDKDPQRVNLGLHTHFAEVAVVAPPETELLELASCQVVQIRNVALVAPPDEVTEARTVPPDRRLRQLRFFLCDVQFQRRFGVDWFEVHGSFGREPLVARPSIQTGPWKPKFDRIRVYHHRSRPSHHSLQCPFVFRTFPTLYSPFSSTHRWTS